MVYTRPRPWNFRTLVSSLLRPSLTEDYGDGETERSTQSQTSFLFPPLLDNQPNRGLLTLLGS